VLRAKVFLRVLACLAAVTCAHADQLAVTLLSNQLKTMENLTARFQQQITDNRGVVLQEAKGTLSVKRPKKFYWHTEQPYEHLIVTDGTILWLHDIDLEQITRQSFSANLDKSPALLLSGEIKQISQQYSIEILAQHQQEVSFKLTPLATDSLFKILTISFNGKLLTAMTWQDGFDQANDIQFSNVKVNQAISDQLFQFVPPDGIDIISNET
jgi:outer membrane lipoprotein carrier protein